MKKQESEFGKGTIYPFVLWAIHLERNRDSKEMRDYSLWFNGASDHLLELVVPKSWGKKTLGKKLRKLTELAISIGHEDRMGDESIAVKEDFERCRQLTKEIAFLMDKELGFDPTRGEYE